MANKEISDLAELTGSGLDDSSWLHAKKGTTDYKMRPQVLFNLYNAQTAGTGDANLNLAKADVGLGNVTDDAQLKIASNLSDLADAATARTNLAVDSSAQVTTKVAAHTNVVTGNPHSVTAADLNLQNVQNYPVTNVITDTSLVKYASINAVSQVNSKVTTLESNVIPVGCVMMWPGSFASIPAGWKPLDGLEGRINMIGMFPRGGGGSEVGDTGGTDVDVHKHTVTVSGHTLSLDEMPVHQHPTAWGQTSLPSYGTNGPNRNLIGDQNSNYNNYEYLSGGPVTHTGNTAVPTSHKYGVNDATKADPHTHIAATADNPSVTENNVPKYHTFIYIIKV